MATAESPRELRIAQSSRRGEELGQNSDAGQPAILSQNSPQATPQESPANGDSDNNSFKPGDEGDAVVELQNRLKQLGHYEGEPTGKYDEKTQESVKKFQTSQDLEPTGIFDLAAFEKLRDLQGIATPTQRQQPRRRPWGWKRKLVFFGGGGVVLLGGTGVAAFLLLRYINKGKNLEEDLPETDIDREAEEEVILTELYPISPRLHKTEPNARADEGKLDGLEAREIRETDAFAPSFPAPAPNQFSNAQREPASPALTANSPVASEVQSDRTSLAPSFATDIPVNSPHFIPSPLDSIEELIRQLHSPDPDKRKKTIWELAREADSRAVQPLVSLLLESDSQQQSLILEALSQIGTRTLKPMNRALALSLQDDNAQVRKNAIRDLTRVYELIAQLSQLIYYATDDPDPEVQETAKWALGQLSHIRMLPSDRNHE